MNTRHENITSTLNLETGEHVYNVPRSTVPVSRQMLLDILDMDGTGYWAKAGKVSGEALTWTVRDAHEYDERGREVRTYRATFERLAVAIVEVADGEHGLRDDIVAEVTESLEEGEWLAGQDVNDCVIQAALFGEVLYS
jgi:hypothetical protein